MSLIGMSVGGVDPSILRELSGVYKPFVKAFKELVSNAYDADADIVSVAFSDDLSSVTISDDGVGMTPFDFRTDFTRIGGSSRRWSRGKTLKGRARIGSKGIGFLALARYCDQMEVRSFRRKVHNIQHTTETPAAIDLRKLIGVPVASKTLASILTCEIRQNSGRRGVLKAGKDFKLDLGRQRISFPKEVGEVLIHISIDCKRLGFRAVLDFKRLLKLADQADLEKLDDFTRIDLFEVPRATPQGTAITVQNIKPFVRQDLRSEKRKGFVRNVASWSGLERFSWALSRCTPVAYRRPSEGESTVLDDLIKNENETDILSKLEVTHAQENKILERPTYLATAIDILRPDMVTQVNVDEGGLKAVGLLAGYDGIIFPAEYRGVSIRVRGIAIGDPTFLGAEFLLTGASKAALSQISGEINVLEGLDAVDALNPGRESFYEESEHFKTLRKQFLGEGERITGYLGRTISAVLRRSAVRGHVAKVLSRASFMRRALDDVSAGITHVVSRGGSNSSAIRRMLKSKRSHTNGLASSKDFSLGIPKTIAGIPVQKARHLEETATIDYNNNVIAVDATRPEWDQHMVLFNRRFEIVHKLGTPQMPIAELDLKSSRILVNWGHSAQSQMDECGFLRTALAWSVSRTAAGNDPDQMMDLALTLLSFTAGPHE